MRTLIYKSALLLCLFLISGCDKEMPLDSGYHKLRITPATYSISSESQTVSAKPEFYDHSEDNETKGLIWYVYHIKITENGNTRTCYYDAKWYDTRLDEINSEWIHIKSDRDTDTLIVEVDENTGASERTATVYVTADWSTSPHLTITQAGKATEWQSSAAF